MPEPLRLLMAEDSPDDAALLEAALRGGGFEPATHRVTTETAFRAALTDPGWDVVLLDYSLPEFSASRGLAILRETASTVPALVVSGTVGEDELVAAVRAGAADYIQKQNLARLVPAVRRERHEAEARRQRERALRERRESEERLLQRLRSSEEHLRTLLDASVSAIVSVDERGEVTYWNRRAAELFGWPAEEAVGRPVADLIVPPALREGYRAALRRHLETGDRGLVNRRTEMTARRQDGSEVPVEVTLAEVPGRAFTAFIDDIRDRKQAEAALRRSEEHFRSLIENASDMIVVADTTRGITYLSPSVERVLGYLAEERLGRSPLELVHPDDQLKVQRLFDDTARPVAIMEPLRVRLRHRDGSWRTMEAVARRQAQEGVVGGVVVNARDITEREHLEAQLLQAQKIEAVGRLAGGIAHDFNNLVTAILGYADLALRRVPAHDPLRRNVEEITRAAERAAALTQQLLAFSRKQVLQPRVLDVREVLEGAQRLLRRLIGEDIELSIRAERGVGRVRVDPVQLEQVLLNLAINARDAMPQGGRLVLEAQDVDLDEAYARDHLGGRAGRFVMLAVSDTGHGMNRETQARIFEPFFTTKEVGKGTGLGLSTVYGIVKQSGGYIWVYSEPGRGSTFKVYLPRIAETEAEALEPEPPALPARGSETVLLVEDEDSVRQLVQELLESVGYEVLTAARPAEALRLAADYVGPLHLLVTDVVMPEMDGPELAQRLRGLRPDVRVLYLSGYSPGIVADHGVLEHGGTFLQKPFSAEALEVKVRETLDTP
jgi:PAS domain S-box-containing protein